MPNPGVAPNTITPRDEVEAQVKAIVLDSELQTAQANATNQNNQFERLVDMFECRRTTKDYKWMSDVCLPEYASHVLSLASDDAMTYFQTRDFVEVYHQSERPAAIASAKSAKTLINNTLNQRHLHHYLKYMRAKVMNNMNSNVILRCWWEQEVEEVETTREVLQDSTEIDNFGNPLLDQSQTPMTVLGEVDDVEENVLIDRFNYDVFEPRNVFFDNTYTYSIQDKKWVIFQYEKTLNDLREDREQFEYFNLDKVKERSAGTPKGKTEVAAGSYDKDENEQVPNLTPLQELRIVERHGKFWAVDTGERDVRGNPIVEPGIDTSGAPVSGAKVFLVIVTFAEDILIRFQYSPFKDARGKQYMPIVRGINYVHPTKDGGMGDGQGSAELQMLIDDSANMANDRVKLATLPIMKARKHAVEDNETLVFAPEAIWELFEPDDVVELVISDDVAGSMGMLDVGRSMMQQYNARYPTTMGAIPEQASTTATAIAGGEQRTNARTGYRSLTWEYSVLQELYWIIQQMTWQFAREETALELFDGEEHLGNFRPDMEFFYKPVTGAIMTEYGKAARIREGTTIMQMLATIPNSKTLGIINMVLGEVMEMWGKEKVQYKDMLLNENEPFNPKGTAGAKGQPGGGPSNQAGIQQSQQEQFTRAGAQGGQV